jgi:uncharacterized protein (TIGR00730 family)
MMNICVFCSSSNQIDERYKKQAFRLGQQIALSGNALLYGGATGGLMDAVAEGARDKKGEVIGVISEAIINMKRESKLPTKLIKVKNLSERKQKMRELGDVFIVLPGGYGTMDEMFDMTAGRLVGEHTKTLFVLNPDGFYDNLQQLFAKMQDEKCIDSNVAYHPVFVDFIEDIFQNLFN